MPHQREGLRYLRRNPRAALFWQMRLGKSLPCIRRAQMLRPRGGDLRALVVAPNSALGGWERELALEGESDVVFLQGTREERLALLQEGHRWCLINKEGWIALPEIGNRVRCEPCKGTGKERCGHCRGLGHVPAEERSAAWDIVILDESTFVKSPRARVTKFFLAAFRDVPNKVVLTGMPNPESELDMWCQLAFLYGEAFGCKSYWQFRSGWFQPSDYGYDWQPRGGALKLIERELAAKTFRLQRRDAGMPDRKVRETRLVQMPKKLRKAYDAAEQDFVLEYDDERLDSTVWSGVRWQWMRQACGGFVDGELVWFGKLDELRSLLRGELCNEQVVTWFCYNQELLAAHARLSAVGIECRLAYGDTPPPERRELEVRFRDGEFRVFLLQQKIAEFGMDLSAADTAVVFSRHPALLTNAQSEDRIVHPRKRQPLLFVDLVVEDTVDEDVSELLRQKRWRSQRVFDGAVCGRMLRRARAC